jgi:hypothetical protein
MRTRQVEDMGIKEMLSTPRAPWQRAYVERVIGTIRRECLDHLIVLNEASLCRHLKSFVTYYHQTRTHLGLDKDTPESRPVQPPDLGPVIAIPQVGGLHSGALPEEFPYSREKLIHLDERNQMAEFGPGIQIPIHPFFGVLGVAPPEGRLSSGPPSYNAGNLDNKWLVAGTCTYPCTCLGRCSRLGTGMRRRATARCA